MENFIIAFSMPFLYSYYAVKYHKKYNVPIKILDILKYPLYLTGISVFLPSISSYKIANKIAKAYVITNIIDDLIDVIHNKEKAYALLNDFSKQTIFEKSYAKVLNNWILKEEKKIMYYADMLSLIQVSTFEATKFMLEFLKRKDLVKDFYYASLVINIADHICDVDEDIKYGGKNIAIFLAKKFKQEGYKDYNEKAKEKLLLTSETALKRIRFKPLKVLSKIYFNIAKKKRLKINLRNKSL